MKTRNTRRPRMDAGRAAELVGLRYGYDDPAAVELRKRHQRDELRKLAAEVGVVLLWLGVAYAWILLTWPGVSE